MRIDACRKIALVQDDRVAQLRVFYPPGTWTALEIPIGQRHNRQAAGYLIFRAGEGQCWYAEQCHHPQDGLQNPSSSGHF